MHVKYISEYSEVYCDGCGEYDWGRFVVSPKGTNICESCVKKINIELKIDDLRNELNKQ